MAFCYQLYVDIHPSGSYHNLKYDMFLSFPDLYIFQVILGFLFSEITNSLTALPVFA